VANDRAATTGEVALAPADGGGQIAVAGSNPAVVVVLGAAVVSVVGAAVVGAAVVGAAVVGAAVVGVDVPVVDGDIVVSVVGSVAGGLELSPLGHATITAIRATAAITPSTITPLRRRCGCG
jgi:hypothetical protein